MLGPLLLSLWPVPLARPARLAALALLGGMCAAILLPVWVSSPALAPLAAACGGLLALLWTGLCLAAVRSSSS